jgi:hypothetical protein
LYGLTVVKVYLAAAYGCRSPISRLTHALVTLLIRPYCVAKEEGERTTADPSLRCASFRMTASGDAILSGRINKGGNGSRKAVAAPEDDCLVALDDSGEAVQVSDRMILAHSWSKCGRGRPHHSRSGDRRSIPEKSIFKRPET